MARRERDDGAAGPGLLRARLVSWFSTTIAVERDGLPWGELRHNFWRDRGVIAVAGEELTVRAEGFLRERFLLCRGQEVVARAHRRRPLCFGYWLEHGGRRWSLRSAGWFSWGFKVGAGEMETEAGWIRHERFFSWTAVARLPDGMPPPVQAFALWLTFVMWRRRAAAS